MTPDDLAEANSYVMTGSMGEGHWHGAVCDSLGAERGLQVKSQQKYGVQSPIITRK